MNLNDVVNKFLSCASIVVYEKNDIIVLGLINVKPKFRNMGIAKKFMIDLKFYADSTGKTITLNPSSEFGADLTRLVKFYKSFGFIYNKGKNKNYAFIDDMYRLPGRRM